MNKALLKDIKRDQRALIEQSKFYCGSHAEVARRLGITRQSYQRYVSGERILSLYYFYSLAELNHIEAKLQLSLTQVAELPIEDS
jgi:transcriptional regulator with XRE-family HTH domain